MDLLSISTVWNNHRFEKGEDVIRDILRLGFRKVELNFQFVEEKLEDVFRLVEDKEVEVTSVHNFCPPPEESIKFGMMPDFYNIASVSEEERKNAVFFTNRSIDTVAALKAKAVVLHSGYVDIESRTKDLIRIYRKEGPNGAKYKKIKSELFEERRSRARIHLESLMDSLSEVLRHAEKRGVVLGIENRNYYREMPIVEESEAIFRGFKGKPVGYWHDTGHAEILEVLGFYPRGYHIGKLGNKLRGIHFHDVHELKDHQAPFQGSVDFKSLKAYYNSDVIPVVEVHGFAKEDELLKGSQKLETLLKGGAK